MNKKLDQLVNKVLQKSHFDSVDIGLVDFSKMEFSTKFYSRNKILGDKFFFDLASLTKPLTLGVTYLINPKLFTYEMKLLLEHRSGLPAWGRLSKDSWKEQILSYQIRESETKYSDFGALRLQLEIEKTLNNQSVYDFISSYLDCDIIHWLDLKDHYCLPTGIRNRKIISGEVHDDNAYVIGSKVCHAGLFGNAKGVCKTLLNLQESFNFVDKLGTISKHRFNHGFDTVSDPKESLAGIFSTKETFGHLGFTGTSFWVYPKINKAVVLLSNETNGYWYSRNHLNSFRKEVSRILLSH